MSDMADDTGATGRRGKGWLVVLAVVLLAVAAVAGVVAMAPASLLTPQVAAKVKAATGLDMHVAGTARYKLLPRFVLHLEDVTLVSPEGGDPVVRAAAVDAVMPLAVALGRPGNVLSVTLEKPELLLVRDATGQANWQSEGGGEAGVPLVLESVAVSEGVLSYRDEKGGTSWNVDEITAHTTMDPATGAITGEGKASYKEKPLTLELAVADGRKLLAGAKADVKAKLAARNVKASFEGQALPGAGEAEGNVTVSAPDAKELAALIGVGTDVLLGEGAVSLTAKVKSYATGFVLSGAQVELGRSRAAGDVEVSLAGVRPAAKGSIAWKELDLTALAPPPKGAMGAAARAATEAAPADGDGMVIDSAYASMEAALARLDQGGAAAEAAPAVAAAAKAPSPWSDEPYDLSQLGALDADLSMRAEKVRVGGLTLMNGDAGVKLDGGKLAVDLKRFDIGKGQVKGTIGLDANAAAPHAAVDLAMKGVPAETLLTEIVGRPVLSGPADVQAQLGASGKSVRQIVSTLEGNVRFAFGKGAIEGFDIPRVLKNLLSGWKYDKRYRTPFNKLEGQYAVNRGVAQSEKDAAFDGEAVDIKANGKVSAPARTLEQHLRLSVTEWGLVFPVYLQGRWDDLHGGFDMLPWLAAPQTYANPLLTASDKAAARAGMPQKLREQIERLLARPASESKLTDAGRAALRELIGSADTGTPAPAAAPPAAPPPAAPAPAAPDTDAPR